MSGTPGVPSSGYHLVIIFLALLLAAPIVSTDLLGSSAGLALLGAETDFFFMVICLGIFFILTVILAPLGIIVL